MPAGPLFDLRCSRCGAEYPEAGFPPLCPRCDAPWESVGLRRREPDAAASGLRRWAAALGLDPEELPEREIARPPARLGTAWIVHLGSAPSGSYKELGAEVMVAAAARRGVRELFLDSSGNAGIAVARAAAARGLRCTVLVPETTTELKKERSRRWGATVETIPGDRDATNLAAQEWRRRLPYAAPFFQPSFQIGVATLVWDFQLAFGDRLPRRWLLPAGNGPLLLGLSLGLATVPAHPALHAVQLEGYASLHPKGPGTAAPGPPVAGGIAIGNPPRRADMKATVAGSGGDVTRVSDEAIAAAREELATAGFPADPTGAAAWAGYRARPDLQSDECLVIVTSREEAVADG